MPWTANYSEISRGKMEYQEMAYGDQLSDFRVIITSAKNERAVTSYILDILYSINLNTINLSML